MAEVSGEKEANTTTPTADPNDVAEELHDYRFFPKGFTNCAFVCETGVIVATDHSYHTKDVETFVENVIDLTPHVLVTCTGAIHAKTFLKIMKFKFCISEHLDQIKIKSVPEVAKWVALYLYHLRVSHLEVELLVAGWDIETEGPMVYHVNKEAARRVEKVRGVTGHGSTCLRFSRHYTQLGYDLASKHAIWVMYMVVHILLYYRNSGICTIDCGGYMSGYHVGANGLERIFHNIPVVDQVEAGEDMNVLRGLYRATGRDVIDQQQRDLCDGFGASKEERSGGFEDTQRSV